VCNATRYMAWALNKESFSFLRMLVAWFALWIIEGFFLIWAQMKSSLGMVTHIPMCAVHYASAKNNLRHCNTNYYQSPHEVWLIAWKLNAAPSRYFSLTRLNRSFPSKLLNKNGKS